MRYFVDCKYKGTHYQGWQRQPHSDQTIQEQIEIALSTISREKIEIVGCGRTDAGVHASQYTFHMDTEYDDIDQLIFKANQILPKDIVLVQGTKVRPQSHARYDASYRGYTYTITKKADPFRLETAYHHFKSSDLDLEKMNAAADILLGEHQFVAFCKTGTDVKTKRCYISESYWTETEDSFIYTVRSDRFLRGMIRLIVGMCINVSRGKLTIEEVKHALHNEERLSMDWSVPGQGLFLDLVVYV